MTLDEHVAWAAGIGVDRHRGVPEERILDVHRLTDALDGLTGGAAYLFAAAAFITRLAGGRRP